MDYYTIIHDPSGRFNRGEQVSGSFIAKLAALYNLPEGLRVRISQFEIATVQYGRLTRESDGLILYSDVSGTFIWFALRPVEFRCGFTSQRENGKAHKAPPFLTGSPEWMSWLIGYRRGKVLIENSSILQRGDL